MMSVAARIQAPERSPSSLRPVVVGSGCGAEMVRAGPRMTASVYVKVRDLRSRPTSRDCR
jgi:hypothetical protein